MKVIKAVRRTDGILKSAIVNKPEYMVVYVPGQPTLPRVRGTGILAFKTEELARQFVRLNARFSIPLSGNPNLELWLAEGQKMKLPKAPCNRDWLTISILQFVWGLKKHPPSFPMLCSWPPGTIACSQLTLISKLPDQQPKRS